MKMPFGKHAGKEVNTDEIPRSYLLWLRNNINLHGHLKDCVERALNTSERVKQEQEIVKLFEQEAEQ